MIVSICCFLLMAVVNWIGLIPWRRAANAHWTERARLLKPVRFTSGLSIFIFAGLLSSLWSVWFHQSAQNEIVNFVAGFLGSLLGTFPLEHEIYPELSFRNWCHQMIAFWGILASFWVSLMLAVFLMPAQLGWRMFFMVAGYLAILSLIQCGGFLQFLRLVKFMRPAGPRLQQIVAGLTGNMNVRVRHTWQLEGTMANAFALPITRELVFTNRLLHVCTDEEVSAICAHELAHLKESGTVLAGRLLGSLSLFPFIFMNPCYEYFGVAGFLVPLLTTLAFVKFTRWLSQKMEKRADQLALTQQTNEGVYACALEKLYRANQTPAVNINNRQTHPHLYDRMLAAGITPDYPRPGKPQRFTLAGWLVLAGIGVLIGLQVLSAKN